MAMKRGNEIKMLAARQSLCCTALGLLIATSAGCAPEPDAVDRVQTNLVDKAVFEGEWWYSNTAIDVDYDQAQIFSSANAFAPFEGSMSTDYGLDFNRGGPYVIGSPTYSFPIARIRWVIDENFLFAFRSFELVQGGSKDAKAPDYRGEPLAVFAIEDHIDIRNDYSTTTGEKTNVRQENTSDRRWFERQFIRVDWSQNRIKDFAANDAEANDLFTRFNRESVPFYVQPGSGHDASYEPQFVRAADDEQYRFGQDWQPRAGQADERDKVHYMSFVTKEVWSPGSRCLTSGGTCASATVTTRNSFLRVPPNHDYSVATVTEREFDHFGIFRSHQPTYARGGEDRGTLREFCASDADCGPGGSCDVTKNICVGGLTADRGETDLLSFFASRQNLYVDSLDASTQCVADWECDGRFLTCEGSSEPGCADSLRARQGSVCDPAAQQCTIPIRAREVKPIVYRLSKHFPPYLVRQTFEAVAQWNEALMRGQRAAIGALPIDQYNCQQGTCTTALSAQTPIACQSDNPTSFCFCGSPEDRGGSCQRSYDAFEAPARAMERGVPNPYDCYIEGPADLAAPQDYQDYDPATAYGYRFVGKECLITLLPNSCDTDRNTPCEELGDLRHQFLTHVQHGAVPFGGVAQPLSDPTTGELIVSNASVAAESIESVGTVASQYFPVLRGDVAEDVYFSGENLRGYYARLGKVEHPVSLATSGTEPYMPRQSGRPAGGSSDLFTQLSARIDALAPKLESLRGQEGRVAIFSDRRPALGVGSAASRIDAAIAADVAPHASSNDAAATPVAPGVSLTPSAAAAPSVVGQSPLDEELAERHRRAAMAGRNMDSFDAKLYHGQYWQYWANAFSGRPLAEASLRMQQLYYRSVMVHEIGHALGLRHNFAGSLDRNHYHDGYFQIARELPLPDYSEYDDPALGGNADGDITGQEAQRWGFDLRQRRAERLARGAGNVMTSSVMDYDGDLSSYAGIGRYDAAAVMFSYFDRVEAFESADPSVDQRATNADAPPRSLVGLQWSDQYRRELWTYYRGGESCVTHSDCPHSAGSVTTMFQPIKQVCAPNPRTPPALNDCGSGSCLCSNFFDDFQPGVSTYTPVSYLYCHDNRTDDLSWCTTMDAGESFQESVEHYRVSWLERYPQLYFRNFKRNGPTRGYATSSIVDAVKLYQHLFFRLYYEPGFREKPGPLGLFDQLLASADVLNWLAEIIASPDVGTYALDEPAGLYRPVASGAGAPPGSVELKPGQAFYLWSAYQEGLNGFFRLERAGTFLDKVRAIEAVSRREWGLTYTIDERFFINFYDLFPDEVTDLFGGLILRNPRAYAPRLLPDPAGGEPTLSYLNLYRGPGGTGVSTEETYGGAAVDGTDSDVLRDAAALYALAEFPVFYDTSFEPRLMVFKYGSGEGYTIPATRADGTPTCAYGADGCDSPDYIVYESDRQHTSFMAVVIEPDGDQPSANDNQQLGFQLLLKLRTEQDQIRALAAQEELSDGERQELSRLRASVERDESFVDYLIELSKEFGISSSLF
jgi:hypothetical protein